MTMSGIMKELRGLWHNKAKNRVETHCNASLPCCKLHFTRDKSRLCFFICGQIQSAVPIIQERGGCYFILFTVDDIDDTVRTRINLKNFLDFLRVLENKLINNMNYTIKIIIIAGIVAIVVMSLLMITSSTKTAVKMDFQVTQDIATDDFYSLFKSSEFVAGAIDEMVSSEEFMNKVIKKDGSVSQKFSNNREERLKQWNETVYVDDITVHGRFSVIISHKDKNFAQQLAPIVSDLIINDNGLYQGAQKKEKQIIIIKNEQGDIIDQYEEDADDGVRLIIRQISGPLEYAKYPLTKIISIGLGAFLITLLIGYIHRVSRTL